MGSGSSKMEPPVVVTSKIPLFCLKKLGPRHLLVAGGGGESKTGVLNLIQTYLITFGNQSGKKRVTRMQAQLVNTIETDIYATMNMDVVCCSNPEQGKYLIAAGHGQYCDVYETTGYAVGKDDAEKEVRKESEKSVQDSVEKEMQNGVREQVHGVAVEENKDGNEKEVLDDDKRRLLDDAKEEVQNDTRKEVRADAKKTVQNDADNGDLSLNIRFVGRLTTSEKVESFQKCVRFDRSTSGRRVVTGGEDGRIRVWNAKALVEDRNPETIHKPTLDIEAHKSDVFDIDIASDGRIIISVGHDGVAKMWDMNLGTLIREIPMPNDCATGYKVRSVRCTPLGSGSNLVFVAAYNAVSITSKRKTYLALWAFSRETQSLRTVTVRSTGQGDGIASLCVSSCGNFTGVGTMGGSVYIYDTHEMKQLAAFKETHGIFVTAVEFLDRTAADVASLITQPPSGPPRKVPGPAYGARASLISLSADQTIQDGDEDGNNDDVRDGEPRGGSKATSSGHPGGDEHDARLRPSQLPTVATTTMAVPRPGDGRWTWLSTRLLRTNAPTKTTCPRTEAPVLCVSGPFQNLPWRANVLAGVSILSIRDGEGVDHGGGIR